METLTAKTLTTKIKLFSVPACLNSSYERYHALQDLELLAHGAVRAHLARIERPAPRDSDRHLVPQPRYLKA